ncbi:MAG TPA: MBL fold metallo-hydrolase [Nakamurella multipartita]|nr:MBL fold metallo-hydrolase [Nakamurella multipartita]
MTHQPPAARRPTARRLTWPVLAIAAISMTALTRTLGRAARGLPTAIGAGPDEIRPVAEGSSRFDGTSFSNVEPAHVFGLRQGLRLLPELLRHRNGHPPMTIPLVTAPPASQAGELAVTWLGHATTLVELDGHFVLTDPVWSQRVSPSATIGPARLHPMPIALAQLPALSAVVISHDHYDHLDLPTIRTLVSTQTAPFVVPLGVGAHLRGWGVPEDRIVELDWTRSTTVGDLEIVCTPGRHFSGRGLRRNTTLWSSWALLGPQHRVYFGGDTGYTTAFADIARQWGPFDVTILPIGAYGDQWPDIHLNPEEAATAHRDLGGALMIPIHWATFDLALHSWAEPMHRLRAAGTDIRIAAPRPGERVVPNDITTTDGWWDVPVE